MSYNLSSVRMFCRIPSITCSDYQGPRKNWYGISNPPAPDFEQFSLSLPSKPFRVADPTHNLIQRLSGTQRCSWMLRQRCPACFGGVIFGRSHNQYVHIYHLIINSHLFYRRGGDVHVAVDGNFHHRHRRTAGDGLPFFDSAYVISKDRVDEIGSVNILMHSDASRRRYMPASSQTRR